MCTNVVVAPTPHSVKVTGSVCQSSPHATRPYLSSSKCPGETDNTAPRPCSSTIEGSIRASYQPGPRRMQNWSDHVLAVTPLIVLRCQPILQDHDIVKKHRLTCSSLSPLWRHQTRRIAPGSEHVVVVRLLSDAPPSPGPGSGFWRTLARPLVRSGPSGEPKSSAGASPFMVS